MFELSERIRIDRPVEVVGAQFADVAYHERSGHHRGVTFHVLDETEERCEYDQATHVGGMQARQRFELDRSDRSHQVNRITAGMFHGGSITFDIVPDGEGSAVTATLRTELSFGTRLASPVLRRSLRRSLTKALEEDRFDLESGTYEAATS